MVKAISDTYPETLTKSRGVTLYHWNIQQEQVEDPMTGKTRTQYVYDEVEIPGKVTKAKILAAIEAAEREEDTGSVAEVSAQHVKASNAKKTLKTIKIEKQGVPNLAKSIALILEILGIEYDDTP